MTTAAVDSPFTIHLSTPNDLDVELLSALAGPALLPRVARVLEVVPHLDPDDAPGRLARLVSLFGWGTLDREALEVCDIDASADDLAAAQSLGGTIAPVLFAERRGPGVLAFAGHAFLSGAMSSGIRLDGLHGRRRTAVQNPGAEPPRGTLAWNPRSEPSCGTLVRNPRALVPTAPATPWVVGLAFPGVVPSDDVVAALAAGAGLRVERPVARGVASGARHARWLLCGLQPREEVDSALARLSHTHRLRTSSWRRV